MTDFLKQINWKELRDDRFNLEYIAEFEPLDDKDINSLYSIVELIDQLQQEAVRSGITKEEVYGQ
jgi:hypothetical protein